jgi:hypothetical protein
MKRRGVQGGVAKGEEVSQRLLALWEGTPETAMRPFQEILPKEGRWVAHGRLKRYFRESMVTS